MYCVDNGRGSVPPSLLATVLLLQTHDKVSNAGAKAQGYERCTGSSVKEEAAIDWFDRRACSALLAKVVADADRLLELSRQAQGEFAEVSGIAGTVATPGRGTDQ